jgi:hypothetical protein
MAQKLVGESAFGRKWRNGSMPVSHKLSCERIAERKSASVSLYTKSTNFSAIGRISGSKNDILLDLLSVQTRISLGWEWMDLGINWTAEEENEDEEEAEEEDDDEEEEVGGVRSAGGDGEREGGDGGEAGGCEVGASGSVAAGRGGGTAPGGRTTAVGSGTTAVEGGTTAAGRAEAASKTKG